MALSVEPRASFLPEADVSGDAPPAIRAVDDLHDVALARNASDIHIEPAPNGGRVRLRVDGVLHDLRQLPPPLFAHVVSRVKLLAGMDIADKRAPQDGRYQIEAHGRCVDARVSSMPTIEGEKLVIRLLDMRARVAQFEGLGMPEMLLRAFRRNVHAPHGFVLVCGPTGSGKTTTLYAALGERNVDGQQCCTVEDPVEVRMSGVAQVQVNSRAGVTFATALRSFLRQDPNVIMVGEMRDAETAAVAMSAALSGTLVLASLHASDAPRTVQRLIELGLNRHAIAAGLSCVLAQRLVRRLCDACRRRRCARGYVKLLGIADGEVVYEPGGCGACEGSGYRGRAGIFEFLPMSPPLRACVADGASPATLTRVACDQGYEPMLTDGARRVRHGDTSVEELRRVLVLGEVA